MMKNLVLLSLIVLISATLYGQKKEKAYKVLGACGQCQFKMTDQEGCDLAIQMGGKYYWVDGSKLSDHGDQHANDGLCMTIKKAVVTGTIEKNRIKVSSFAFLDDKKKTGKKKK